MSVLVVVFDEEPPPGIAGDTAHALARLGVTEVTLADGPAGSAVVLTGWAFDSRRHEESVVSLIAPGRRARVLHGIADVVLRPASTVKEQYSA